MIGEAMTFERRCDHGFLRSVQTCESCERIEARAKRIQIERTETAQAPAPALQLVELPELPDIPRANVSNIPQRAGDVTEAIRCVAKSYMITVSVLLSKDRHQSVAEGRGVLCWLLRTLTDLSYPEIGRALAGRDHTTIMSAVKKCVRRRALEPAFLAFTDELAAAVSARMGGT